MKKFALNLWGWCAAFAILGTARAQTITNQPQSVIVNNASTAEFSVGATNAATYQWQFNSTNLVDGGNISGSSTSTLTLEDVNSNQMGNYSVMLNGSVTSSNATLTVTNGTIVTFVFSGFIGGGTSNVDVQFFDHDKPATVQNFLHYITSGAFSNMFIHRDAGVGGFAIPVIQGGGFGASNRTATAAPLTGWTIPNITPSTPFPAQVDNEFGTGPVIHNRFGTICMALGSSSNSATSEFFFNLADNTSLLDSQNFVVFGRILDGTNALTYFNGLSAGDGIFIDPQILTTGSLITIPFSTPVNYISASAPGNSNLVFCNFLYTNVPVDTNPPTVAITSPANMLLTNALQGTAQDDVGLANVFAVLIPQVATDGVSYPAPYTNGAPATNFAIGTTNWALSLSPGVYDVSVQAQDGAGNLSQATNQVVTNTSVYIVGNGTVTYSNFNAVGFPFQNLSQYDLLAVPGSNDLFVSWTTPTVTDFNPAFSFLSLNNFIATATFISNGMPNSLAFTYPTSNGFAASNTFDITGTISNVPSPPATVTVQIVSQATSSSVGTFPATVTGTTWSATTTNLPLGSYSVEALATDQASNSTVISEDFTVTTNASLLLDVVGPGKVSGATNGEALLVGTNFPAAATPDAGDVFYTWTYGTNASIDPMVTETMAAGVTLTATFVSNNLPNGIAFTAPPTNVILSNGTVEVSGTLSNFPSPPVELTCQIFSQSNLTAVTPALTNTGTPTWSFQQGNLVAGNYIAVVLAVDQAGNSALITEDFTATVDTNLPVITVLTPTPYALLTANNPVIVTGTASDSVVSIASARCFLVPQVGNFSLVLAAGTSNWTADFGLMPPGAYRIDARAFDTVGNFQDDFSVFFTNTAILIDGLGTVSVTQGATNVTNVVGYPFQTNISYQVVATPGPGQSFVSWTAGAFISINPTQNFTMSPGFLLTATFVPSNTAKGLSFTYPAANSGLRTNSFVMKGRMTAGFKAAPVSCRIYSLTTNFEMGPFTAVSGSTTWSAAVNDLPTDNYVVVAEATNGQGQNSTISEKFAILAFSDMVGTYSGLFISTNAPVSPTNSGFVQFTVAANGLFTGKLIFPAYAPIPIYPLPFHNDYFTSGFATFGLTNFHGDTWNGFIDMNLNGSSDVAFGQIVSQGWSALVICYRDVATLSSATAPAPGPYAFSIAPGGGTNGYVSLTASKGGVLTVTGALPDNTTFSQSARVSKEGVWPLFAIPAGDGGGKGMLLGWETNLPAGGASGQVYWYKKPRVGAYYTNGTGVGTNLLVNVTGTNFLRPAEGSQYSIVFSGGSIVPPLTNFLGVNDAGRWVVTGGAADKLRISMTANGVLTGSLFNSNDNRALPFRGIFISASQGGSGFIPEPNGQTGCFALAPLP